MCSNIALTQVIPSQDLGDLEQRGFRSLRLLLLNPTVQRQLRLPISTHHYLGHLQATVWPGHQHAGERRLRQAGAGCQAGGIPVPEEQLLLWSGRLPRRTQVQGPEHSPD